MNKVYIPSKYFSNCNYIKNQSEWVNSVLVENEIEVTFKGAVFNIGRQDVNYLINQGFNNVRDFKKIYCYIDLELNGTVRFNDNDYTIVAIKNYMIHDKLRIYYVERLEQ